MVKREKVLTVTRLTNENDKERIKELRDLVYSSLGEVIIEVSQETDINPKYYIGRGKLEEIKALCEKNNINKVIFNNELSGSQMRNIEKLIDKKIVDRTGLILDIFARRAKTKESKLQVKLAQLEYRLPRLVGYRNYLSREGAGIGTRGPGEQKLELDKRAILSNISIIKKQLKEIKERRKVSQNLRKKSLDPIISLVGYSNAGKSTILNGLLEISVNEDKKVYADDMLFATLDTFARRISYDNRNFIVSDTVGFVTDLPEKLREAFNSTLEEIELSDLVLIVIDASREDFDMQIRASQNAMRDLKIDEDRILYVYNKIDLNNNFYIEKKIDSIKISALKKSDLESLLERITEKTFGKKKTKKVHINFENMKVFSEIKDKFIIIDENYDEKGVNITFEYRSKDLENVDL